MKKILSYIASIALLIPSFSAMPNKPNERPANYENLEEAYVNFEKYGYDSNRVRTIGRNNDILEFNLHGFNKTDAEIAYYDAVSLLGSEYKTIHFITGKGIHSVNNDPVIKPLILELSKCRGGKVDKYNDGVVIVRFSQK